MPPGSGQNGAIPLHHLHRRMTTRGSSKPVISFKPVEKQFLEACSACAVSDLDDDAAKAYLAHFSSILEGRWHTVFDSFLGPSLPATDGPTAKAMQFCCKLIVVYRDLGNPSICRAIKRLQQDHVFVADDDLCSRIEVQQLVFNAIGWISLLYVPDRTLGTNSFRVQITSKNSEIKPSVTREQAQRPLDELFRSFGDVLPRSQRRMSGLAEQSSDHAGAKKLLVSCLNMATMKTLAGMEIVWVASPSAHLEFDPTIPSISIFRCPSLCKIQKSPVSIMALMLSGCYDDEEEMPSKDFCVANYLKEIELSYALLFKHERKSRKLYQRHERNRAAFSVCGEDITDPRLDELCIGQEAASVRGSFQASTDFPILSKRLIRVQQYMEGIEPNKFLLVWRDRRDLRLWYGIWIVIILQIIALIEGGIAVVLTGMQVNYAQKAYDLQVRQTPNP